MHQVLLKHVSVAFRNKQKNVKSLQNKNLNTKDKSDISPQIFVGEMHDGS